MPHTASRRHSGPVPHRRRARIGAAVIAVAALTAGLAGCATGSGDGTAEITFHMSKPEAIPYFRDLVERYNAEQDGVHVTLDTASNLSAGFLRGNPPDVGLLNYNMEMARFQERGALSDLSLDIASAHITTFGEKVIDTFYVTDLTGQKVENETRLEAIRKRLVATLEAERAPKLRAAAE